jgi:hypothetical protein
MLGFDCCWPAPTLLPWGLGLGLLPGWRFRLGAGAWAQRGGGSPQRGGGAGAGVGGPRPGQRQGAMGGLPKRSRRRWRSTCDWAREDKEPGSGTPVMVTTTRVGLSASSPRRQGRDGWGHGAGCKQAGARGRAGRVWPASWPPGYRGKVPSGLEAAGLGERQGRGVRLSRFEVGVLKNSPSPATNLWDVLGTQKTGPI